MKIKAQMAMVLNLDKCLGCHTCSLPCKNAWTSAPGTEYMWFNHVETKPGIGYPKQWENQDIHKGGWHLKHGSPELVAGGKLTRAANLFGTAHMPTLDDYYDPWDFDYANLTTSPAVKHQPTAQAISALTGKPTSISWGPNWEDDLGGVGVTGMNDLNFKNLQTKTWLQFKNVFMLHLPRLCEHCLNPACVASCPSGAMYKRDEDGIVLVDQSRCRSWRYCVSGCPYKKVYFNWKTHRSEKCLFCYPRVEAGIPTLCAHSCVGRIRYVGIMLYDADKVHTAASTPLEPNLYESQLSVFVNPNDPVIRRQAEKDGVPHTFIEAARHSPIYKLVADWRLALPLHPEFRTLPMVWYVPPTSPLTQGGVDDAKSLDRMRIPLQYLANLLTAGDEGPVRAALGKLLAMRAFMRDEKLGRAPNTAALAEAGLSVEDLRAMYRLLALARYDERFVVPSARREQGNDLWTLKDEGGFQVDSER